MKQYLPRKNSLLNVLIDLSTLSSCGKFLYLSTPTENKEKLRLWVRVLNGKRGLHIVAVPWE
ncbi:hypothetical protein NDA00_26720 [Funiculus sociatus GB2-M2]|uniref:hypothetical protein n=1 Tax=Funiculus sociatus TaxID=450527 RepID=UPI003298DD67